MSSLQASYPPKDRGGREKGYELVSDDPFQDDYANTSSDTFLLTKNEPPTTEITYEKDGTKVMTVTSLSTVVTKNLKNIFSFDDPSSMNYSALPDHVEEVEEEIINPDGTKSLIRKKIVTTTSYVTEVSDEKNLSPVRSGRLPLGSVTYKVVQTNRRSDALSLSSSMDSRPHGLLAGSMANKLAGSQAPLPSGDLAYSSTDIVPQSELQNMQDPDDYGDVIFEVDPASLYLLLNSDEPQVVANVAGYIQHITFCDDIVKAKIRELDIIPILVKLLDHEQEYCYRNAAGALRNLSCGPHSLDNKIAIYDCGGIPACVRLLNRTSYQVVREHLTGILYNLSSMEELKQEVFEHSVFLVISLVIIPYSGWDVSYHGIDEPREPSWSLLMRNATGILRNTSSIGRDVREKMRFCEYLIESLLWMVRYSLLSNNPDLVNHKVIENCTSILRNLSYKIDTEIDRAIFLDAVKLDTPSNVQAQDQSDQSAKPVPLSASKPLFGLFGMKKKAMAPTQEGIKVRRMPLSPGNRIVPPRMDRRPIGVELLWSLDTVDLYTKFIKQASNLEILEAACGAIHNLVACKWNWAALQRAFIRKEKALPSLVGLLAVKQEFVTRAVVYALRNLAIDPMNKELIGRYAMKDLIQLLPSEDAPSTSFTPSDSTIVCLLSVVLLLVAGNSSNLGMLKELTVVPLLVALTRDYDPESPARTYTKPVNVGAHRLLLYLRSSALGLHLKSQIKKHRWNRTKAAAEVRNFKAAVMRLGQRKADNLADPIDALDPAMLMLQLDPRRFVNVVVDDAEEVADQVFLPAPSQGSQQPTVEADHRWAGGHPDLNSVGEAEAIPLLPVVNAKTRGPPANPDSWV